MSDNVKINVYDDFADCDGKKCGLGKYAGGGKYLCPHDNLQIKHPELIKQWHPDNKPMTSYTSGSGQKVWWICENNPCGCHIWEININSRTRKEKPTGCPYCKKGKVCMHNNLEVQFPHLKIECDPNNLKKMSEYTSHSGQKVLWICKISPCACHKWEINISNRTSKDKPTGCPYCNSGKVCEHHNLETMFPQLKIEWDPNNLKSMCEYPPESHDTVLWVCQNGKCDCHKWSARIQNRTNKDRPSGCPFCSKNPSRVCKHNNLEINFPELKCEWYPDNTKSMSEYSSGANDKVWWICSKGTCDCHIWDAYIYDRTRKVKPTGCPFCDNKKVCEHNNFETEHPELKIEWYSDNTKLMSEYSSGSNIIVKWICSKNPSHILPTTIYCRTKKDGSNCPHCSKSKGYSKAEINWITGIEEKENIVIRNALSENGQLKIAGVGKVDGYCLLTNTVYEFHGDFWHGNPSIYDRDKINQVTKSTFGELYDKTVKRDTKIRELGYNLIVKCESEISYIEPRVEELDNEY